MPGPNYEVSCLDCGKQLKIEARRIGKRDIHCADCGTRIEFPALEILRRINLTSIETMATVEGSALDRRVIIEYQGIESKSSVQVSFSSREINDTDLVILARHAFHQHVKLLAENTIGWELTADEIASIRNYPGST